MSKDQNEKKKKKIQRWTQANGQSKIKLNEKKTSNRRKKNETMRKSIIHAQAPGNPMNEGWWRCSVERSGGNNGGSCGSKPPEDGSDEGEVIGGSRRENPAIKLLSAEFDFRGKIRRFPLRLNFFSDRPKRLTWSFQAAIIRREARVLPRCRIPSFLKSSAQIHLMEMSHCLSLETDQLYASTETSLTLR